MGLAVRLEKKYYREGTVRRYFADINPLVYYYHHHSPLKKEFVMSSNYYLNWLIQDYIRYVTTYVDSLKVFIKGDPGTGKTMLGMAFADEVLKRSGGRLYHVFGIESFLDSLPDIISTNDVVLIDELTEIEGEGSVKILKRLENVANTLRAMQIHLIFINPRQKFLERIRPLAVFEICGMNRKKRLTEFLIFLRNKLYGKAYMKIKDLERYKELEAPKKKAFMEFIKSSGGKVTLNLNKNEGDQKAEEEITEENFTFVEDSIRETILENIHDPQTKLILRKWFDGIGQIEIAEELGIPQGTVSKRKNAFAERRLGYILERYFREKFGDKRELISRAPQGVADVIGEDGTVYSVKGRISKQNHVVVNIYDKDSGCLPEIMEAEKNGTYTFKLIFVNPIWYDGYKIVEVDPRKHSQVIFYKNGDVKLI